MIKSAEADNLSETVSVKGLSKGSTDHNHSLWPPWTMVHCHQSLIYLWVSLSGEPISRLFVDP